MTPIFIFSDIRLYRESLERYLVDRLEITVAGTASDANTSIESVRALDTEVVLIDMSMTGALDLCRQASAHGLRVVALGCPDDDEVVRTCARLKVGGFVCRAASLDDLRKAVLGARSGRPYFDAGVSSIILRCVGGRPDQLDEASEARESIAEEADLTRRERQIARLFATGLTNKDIARRLSIEVSTVKNHVHNILAKLDARSRTEAAHKISSGAFR